MVPKLVGTALEQQSSDHESAEVEKLDEEANKDKPQAEGDSTWGLLCEDSTTYITNINQLSCSETQSDCA